MCRKVIIYVTTLFLCVILVVNLKQWKMFNHGKLEELQDSDKQRMVIGIHESEWSPDDSDYIQRLPDAIIIGVSKCGTRALIDFLKNHPSVVIASGEPQFFNRDNSYSQGYGKYVSLFPKAFPNQTVVEKSPDYISCQKSPSRIKLMNASLKMIIIMCEPLTRLRSQLMHWQRHGDPITQSDFEKQILNEETGKVYLQSYAIKQGRYAKLLQYWYSYFPREQFHIIDGEKFQNDPASEMKRLENFLKLESFFKSEYFFFNETKGFFCNAFPYQQAHCLDDKKGHKDKTPLNPNVEKKVKEFYQKDNKDLHLLVGSYMSWE